VYLYKANKNSTCRSINTGRINGPECLLNDLDLGLECGNKKYEMRMRVDSIASTATNGVE